MKVFTCFLLFRIFAYTNSSPLKTPQEAKKGTNLAFKLFLQLHVKENSNKNVIDDNKTPRPEFRAPGVETFTDFIQGVANILNNYDDTAFKDFFDILDEEIRKYHYRGCKFYELTENYEFRSLMAEKLDLIKRKPVPVLKADINELVNMIRNKKCDKNVKEMLDYINSLYREDAREKFGKVLSDLKAYSNSTSASSKNNLVEIIRDSVRAIIFNHFTDLNSNVRRELKREIATFLNKIIGTPSSSPKIYLFPYKPAVRKSENTVKTSGFNIAIKNKNTAHTRNSTTTADHNNIPTFKAINEKHGDKATKLKTSKEEGHNQQLQITYVNTDESSAYETIEVDSKELSQEHQEFKGSHTSQFIEEIFGKNTENPEFMYKSELKSNLVQRMLIEESTGRLPTVQPTIKPGLRQETASNENTEVDPVILIKANNSRDGSGEQLRRSIPPPLPEEELSIDVFDREERKKQKSLAKNNNIITVQHGIKNYIKRMRDLQNKVNLLKKINEYNINSRANDILSNDKIMKKHKQKIKKNINKKAKDTKHKDKNKRKKSKKIKKTKHVSERQSDAYELRTQTEVNNNTDGKSKRDVKRTNSVDEDLKSNTTGAVTSVNIRVRRTLEPLPTATNNASNTTVNNNHKKLTNTTFNVTKKVRNTTLKITEEVKQKRINNTANNNLNLTKDNPNHRYRKVLEVSSPPLYDQPFFNDLVVMNLLG